MSLRVARAVSWGRAFIGALVTATMLCGCVDHKTPAPKARVAFPQLNIRPIVESSDKHSTNGKPAGKISWEIHVAQFHDDQIAELGLERLFETAGKTSATAQSSIDEHSFTKLAHSRTNVNLTIHSNTFSGICDSGTVSNLFQKFERTSRIDFLSTPPGVTSGSNPAEIKFQDQATVTFPLAGNVGNRPQVKLAVGVELHLQVLDVQENAASLQVNYFNTLFKGYPKKGAPGKTGPILELNVLHEVADLKPGETLLLGTEKIPSLQITVERTAYVSEIPIIGELFVKRTTVTNYLRQVVTISRSPNKSEVKAD